MKTLPGGWLDALKAGQQPRCLYTITRKNGAVLYYTDHVIDIAYGGHTFIHNVGITRSAISLVEGTDSANFDFTMFINAGGITRGDVIAGIFRGATIALDLILADNISLGVVEMFYGDVGEFKPELAQCTFTCHSLTGRLDYQTARVTQSTCPYQLGDSQCTKDISSYITTKTITSVYLNNQFTFSGDLGAVLDTTTWNKGFATFTSGLNSGFSFDIYTYTFGSGIGTITFWIQPPYQVAVSDVIVITPGCNKLLANNTLTFNSNLDPIFSITGCHCQATFANGESFGGQLYVPGTDKMNNGVQ